MRWVQRILWVVFILNLLGLAGLTVLYFGGPGWLQKQLPTALERQIGRPVQLTQVRVEPLSLKLILQGLEIREADVSETFVSLEEIGIDLSWNSLWQWALVVEAEMTRLLGGENSVQKYCRFDRGASPETAVSPAEL